MRKIINTERSGFVMPTVIVLISLMAVIAYAALLQANNGLNLAYKQAYIQIARNASKAALDFAQEQFDNSTCGNYTGTAEQDLISNNRYRVTMKAEVIDTSVDGLEKTIKGTGSVYLPKLSTTAQYVFDIRSEIVRTYAACKTPDNFAPLLWLDASDYTTLNKVTGGTTTLTPGTSYGFASDSTRDTKEERADNGTQTSASWQSNDFEMHTCDGTEFTNSICNSNSTKHLNIGMIYSNVNVPQGSTISSASITLACTTPSGTGGTVNHRVYGFYKSATDLHPDLFTQSGINELRTPLNTASLHTTAYNNNSDNNCPPGNNTVYDVTDVVQEIVNNSNWDPNTGNGRMGFIIRRVSGSGSRHLLKDGNQLTINYAGAGTLSQASNGETVGQWNDKSGNGNHAVSAHGNVPTRVDNQINGQTVVRFNNGDLLSSLTSALSGKREMTVFAVANVNFAGSNTDGRLVSGTSSSANNDTTSGSSIIPLERYSNGSGFSSIYSGSASTYRTNFTCAAACSNTPYLYVSNFAVDSTSNTITSTLKGGGAQVAQNTGYAPSGSPYTFGLDQIYIGGSRNGAMPGSGSNYLNGDFGEIIVYDYSLSCRQIEALEEYFRAKWGLSATQYVGACPADLIPTL